MEPSECLLDCAELVSNALLFVLSVRGHVSSLMGLLTLGIVVDDGSFGVRDNHANT